MNFPGNFNESMPESNKTPGKRDMENVDSSVEQPNDPAKKLKSSYGVGIFSRGIYVFIRTSLYLKLSFIIQEDNPTINPAESSFEQQDYNSGIGFAIGF